MVPQIASNNINYNLLFYPSSEANNGMLEKFTFMLCWMYAKQVGIIVKLFSLRQHMHMKTNQYDLEDNTCVKSSNPPSNPSPPLVLLPRDDIFS